MEDHPKYQTGPTPDVEPKIDHWPTTDELIALARAHRQGKAYPAPARRIENRPVVMRGLCDDVLSGEADAYHTADAIASLIEVIESVGTEVVPPNSNQQ